MFKPRIAPILALSLSLLPRAASAQATPKFEFGKAEGNPVEVKPVEWKAQAKGGAIITSGNSSTVNGTLSVTASRKEGNNRLTVDGGFAYGRSRVPTQPFTTNPAMPTEVTDLNEQWVDTTNQWQAKGRYDRFFTLNNSGYVSGLAASDKIAGKAFSGGGQVGYSRQIVKTNAITLVGEVGYDFSYERYIEQNNVRPPAVAIHSARLFVGQVLKLSEATGLTGSVEALLNLNKEGKAIDVDTNTPGVAALHDTRITGKAGLTTTLFKSLSLGIGFTLKYDQNPAPRLIPPTVTAAIPGATLGPGVRFAQSVDTLTDLTLIYTFL